MDVGALEDIWTDALTGRNLHVVHVKAIPDKTIFASWKLLIGY
jgi:hypothetical protein